MYYSKEFFLHLEGYTQTMHELKFISLLTHNKVLEVILGLLEKRLKVKNCFTSLKNNNKKKLSVTLAYELVIGPFSFHYLLQNKREDFQYS